LLMIRFFAPETPEKTRLHCVLWGGNLVTCAGRKKERKKQKFAHKN